MNELVSIAIALYNREDYIRDTLKSLQNQTYANFECIIVDDHSTDNSVNIVYNEFCRRDNRFKLFTNCTSKQYVDAHNKSYEFCTGKYLFRIDADDIFMPDYIKNTVEFMEQHPEYDAVSSKQELIKRESYEVFYDMNAGEDEEFYWYRHAFSDEERNWFNVNTCHSYLGNTVLWSNPSSCLRKDFYDKHHPAYHAYAYGDYIFWWNVLAEGGKLFSIKDTWSYCMAHTSVSADPKFYELTNEEKYLLASFKESAFIKTNQPELAEQFRIEKEQYI